MTRCLTVFRMITDVTASFTSDFNSQREESLTFAGNTHWLQIVCLFLAVTRQCLEFTIGLQHS